MQPHLLQPSPRRLFVAIDESNGDDHTVISRMWLHPDGSCTVISVESPEMYHAREKAERRDRIIWLCVILALAALCFWLGWEAEAKEQDAELELRSSRCASMGENIPPEMQGYCEGLGT